MKILDGLPREELVSAIIYVENNQSTCSFALLNVFKTFVQKTLLMNILLLLINWNSQSYNRKKRKVSLSCFWVSRREHSLH